MSSQTEFAIKVPIKSGLVAAAEYAEHSLIHRCGVPKKYAVPIMFTWELLHQGGVEAVAGLLREQRPGLTALEEAAIITGLEAAIAAGALALVPLETPVIVVVAAGIGVVIGVGLAEPYVLDLAAYMKRELQAGMPVQEPCDELYWLGRDAKQLFQHSLVADRPLGMGDPLALDLDGDGIQTTNIKAGAYFDHDGNGFAEHTGWIDPRDGLLAMDRNDDGIINDGKELFGDRTSLKNGQRATDGFQALAELDTNKDGKIDANDAAFSKLRVWTDINGDDYSAPDELLTLDELGIKSINLDSTITHVAPDAQGNTQTRLGSFEKIDGTAGQIAEYNLQRDTVYSIPNQYFDVPDDIAALPDLQGAGNVYDLDQAMAMDTSGQLKSLVEQFAATPDISGRDALMQQILFKWTGAASRAVPRSARDHRRVRGEREEQLFELFSAVSATSAVNAFALVA